MVARKKRDYRAEYQRRNAKAKAEGYGTYGKRRKLTELGKIVNTGRGFRANVPSANEKVRDENGRLLRVYERAGWESPQEYTQMMKEIKAYIETRADKSQMSVPSKEELKSPELARAYYDAFVKGTNDGNVAKHYLVDVAGKITEAGWRKKYSNRKWSSNRAAVLDDSWEREQGM